MAWPAAHQRAMQRDWYARVSGRTHSLRYDLRRRGHHQLRAVFHRPIAIEEQDILGTGANINRENTHWVYSCC